MGGAGTLRSSEGLLSAPLAQPPHTQSFNLQSVPREAKRREAGGSAPCCGAGDRSTSLSHPGCQLPARASAEPMGVSHMGLTETWSLSCRLGWRREVGGPSPCWWGTRLPVARVVSRGGPPSRDLCLCACMCACVCV